MKKFAQLKTKTYRYLTDENAKGTKKCVVKIKLKFEDYEHLKQLIDSIETYAYGTKIL